VLFNFDLSTVKLNWLDTTGPSKWLDFRVFSDKDVKMVGISNPFQVAWTIGCWEICSPISEKLDKQ
jgi:hypothetical protein